VHLNTKQVPISVKPVNLSTSYSRQTLQTPEPLLVAVSPGEKPL
jgi:hypothetical protein